MARVVLIGNLAQLTGGVAEFDLSVTSVKQLFARLTELHPALARHLDGTGRAVEIFGVTTLGDVSRAQLTQIGGTGVFVSAHRAQDPPPSAPQPDRAGDRAAAGDAGDAAEQGQGRIDHPGARRVFAAGQVLDRPDRDARRLQVDQQLRQAALAVLGDPAPSSVWRAPSVTTTSCWPGCASRA